MLRRHQTGFSLIDLLVGLVVGLLVALAVYATTAFLMEQQRSAVSGHSALDHAMAAALAVQHEVKTSGLGIWYRGRAMCRNVNVYHSAVVADGEAIAPVVITAGADDQLSDEVTTAAATSLLGAVPLPLLGNMASPAAAFTVTRHAPLVAGQHVLLSAVDGALPCTLLEVTATAVDGLGMVVQHQPSSAWNPADPADVFSQAPAYPAGAYALPVGSLRWTTFRVRNRVLQALDRTTQAIVPIAENVMLFRAYYGVSNGVTPQIEQWVPAVDSWAAPLDEPHINAVRALRLAVVVRSPQQEKQRPNEPCTSTTANPVAWPEGPVLDLSADPLWRCYRYRTVSLVIPLKNQLFAEVE